MVPMTWIKANLPADLHRWLKVKAAQQGTTIAQLVTELVEDAKRKDEK